MIILFFITICFIFALFLIITKAIRLESHKVNSQLYENCVKFHVHYSNHTNSTAIQKKKKLNENKIHIQIASKQKYMTKTYTTFFFCLEYSKSKLNYCNKLFNNVKALGWSAWKQCVLVYWIQMRDIIMLIKKKGKRFTKANRFLKVLKENVNFHRLLRIFKMMHTLFLRRSISYNMIRCIFFVCFYIFLVLFF